MPRNSRAQPTRSGSGRPCGEKGADHCLTRMNRFTTDVIVRYGDALADLFCQFPDDVVFAVPYEFARDINLPISPAPSATLRL